jgi:hypothetical protein
MSQFTCFTKHSELRLLQRSILTEENLIKILDAKVFINIGTEPGFNREHRLIFSISDQAHYVVIQDAHVGRVVTILPVEYHNRISWKVKDSEMIAAEKLAHKHAAELVKANKLSQDNPLNKFIITAIFLEGTERKCKQLFSFKEHSNKPMTVKSINKTRIFDFIKDNKITNLIGVSIKNKTSGCMEFFDWNNNELMAA